LEIIHKSVQDLNKIEYRACYAANLGYEGYMRDELVLCRNGRTGQVIMLWDGPSDTARSLIGWALLTPVRLYGMIAATRWVKYRSKFTVEFWVKKKYRKKGYGKILMAEVKKLDDNPHVFPHDTASAEFFSSYKCQVLQIDKHHMRPKPQIA